jgi:ornithine cyclodeaminase/alanine dehydrogenase-like protein (mu-crystallin family)
MKYCIAFITAALAVVSVQGFAFHPAGGRSMASSSLSMNVEQNTAAKEIKVGVIGCGRIGIVHLEAITKAPGVKAVIVSNPTVSKAEKGTFSCTYRLLLTFFSNPCIHHFRF